MQEIMNFSSPKDALEWSTIIAKSKFCPKEFFNHPESVLVAIAYGAELGLKPLQSLQNIAVINGKPSIYGDAMLAVCKNSGDFEYINESFTAADCARCVVKRKNQPEVAVNFGIKEAQLAGLWGKPGPWKMYPGRMLQMRARSFALRDCFPDVLKGMIAVEEAQDYTSARDVTPTVKVLEQSPSPHEELYALMMHTIYKHNVHNDLIEKWKTHAKVHHMRQLSDEQMQSIINHLEKQAEERNDAVEI